MSRRLSRRPVLGALLLAVALLCCAGIAQCARGTAADGVSGVAAPRGDLPGWRQVFVDDFTGDQLSESDWGRYSGKPGGDPASFWLPSHTVVRDGMLTLRGYREFGRMVTGGVGMWPRPQTYGKWEVRLRADPSDDVTFHLLLWPRDEIWPPEIDFAENFGGARDYVDGFLHWTDSGGRRKAQQAVRADFSRWNTVGVEWLPGMVRYTLNGQVWGVETGDRVPNTPMWLALQTQSGGCAKAVEYGVAPCPWVGTPDHTEIQIDWVSVYAPTLPMAGK